MHRIDGAGHINGQFVSEDAALSRPPTEVTAEIMNAFQEELATFIESAGVVLKKSDNTQLTQALLASFLLKKDYALSSVLPSALAAKADAGKATAAARGDHVHPLPTQFADINHGHNSYALLGHNHADYAPLASPAFTDTPTAPTPPLFDNSTKLATANFVRRSGLMFNYRVSVTADREATVDDVGRILEINTSAVTLTLPTPASLGAPTGATITVHGAYGPSKVKTGVGATFNNRASGEVIINRNFCIFVVSSTTQWLPLGVDALSQAGEVSYFALPAAPEGWLKANGALVSRTTYWPLFAAIGTTFGAGNGTTTFALPDLRGEFLRGVDDGRGVDAGRVLGGYQTDAFRSHSHDAYYSYAGTASAPGLQGGVSYQLTRDTNAVGGSETRPRNIALLACIKY